MEMSTHRFNVARLYGRRLRRVARYLAVAVALLALTLVIGDLWLPGGWSVLVRVALQLLLLLAFGGWTYCCGWLHRDQRRGLRRAEQDGA